MALLLVVEQEREVAEALRKGSFSSGYWIVCIPPVAVGMPPATPVGAGRSPAADGCSLKPIVYVSIMCRKVMPIPFSTPMP